MNVRDLIPSVFIEIGAYIYVGTHDREQCRAKSKTDPRLYPSHSLLGDTPSWVGSCELGNSGGQHGQYSEESQQGYLRHPKTAI